MARRGRPRTIRLRMEWHGVPAWIVRVEVDPVAPEVAAGASQQFTATAVGLNHRVVADAEWAVIGSGTITQHGVYTAGDEAGTDIVVATVRTVSGRATVAVTAAAPPSVAVFSDGDGGWLIRTENTEAPDGYIVTRDDGETFVIDPDAESGLTLTVVDGRPQVTYP